MERRLTQLPQCQAFIRALRHYVYLKRAREVYLKTWGWDSRRVYGGPAIQEEEIVVAQQAKDAALWALAQVIGRVAAEALQRQMGSRLSLRAFRMGRQRSEDVC